MKKYKLLRFDRCYLNKEGDFVIGLLSGCKKHGYTFVGSHANHAVFLGTFRLLSRVVPNDGNWIEVDPQTFNVASSLHVSGHVVKFPAGYTGKELPVISKKY